MGALHDARESITDSSPLRSHQGPRGHKGPVEDSFPCSRVAVTWHLNTHSAVSTIILYNHNVRHVHWRCKGDFHKLSVEMRRSLLRACTILAQTINSTGAPCTC